MLVSLNAPVAATYDDFKALVTKLAPNGADVFYVATGVGGVNLKHIHAIVRGEPGCKGEFPTAVTMTADMGTFSISIASTVLVDFPGAVELKSQVIVST